LKTATTVDAVDCGVLVDAVVEVDVEVEVVPVVTHAVAPTITMTAATNATTTPGRAHHGFLGVPAPGARVQAVRIEVAGSGPGFPA